MTVDSEVPLKQLSLINNNEKDPRKAFKSHTWTPLALAGDFRWQMDHRVSKHFPDQAWAGAERSRKPLGWGCLAP